mmetsp:Transcript_40356/g.38831  ORF Transcript_40356/g.38831 Transcript_40356/m.38831 type:complete len:117 (-) Transcript_40356:39-389(-)
MGNGRYAFELEYPEWYSFNNWQRVHYNFLEQLVPILVFLIVCSFYQPLAAAILGFVYFFGRLVYSIGYCRGPNSRSIGAGILDVAFIVALGLAVASIFLMDIPPTNVVGVTSNGNN